ncbi:hypothetical protein BJF84_21340 [Rhodococcus sp. CUA-806]|nr:hypothetical protein BJF84_21340 [Rhodococcus sp. CUA-806]
MGMFHDVVAPTLSDAQLRIVLKRWFPGDPQPAPGHMFLTQSTLTVDVVDQSGYCGPSGTLLDGLLHFAKSVADDFINEVSTQFSYNVNQPEYDITGFLGTIKEPWTAFRKAHKTGATGIVEWERHRLKSNASIAVTGGHSPDWVNTGLKLLVNGVLGYIGAMFGNPGLTLGLFDSVVEDVVLAFHRVGNPIRQAKMGLRGPPLGEVFESSGGTGFSLSALQAIRVAMWRSRPMQTFKFTIRNGMPYWVGLDMDLATAARSSTAAGRSCTSSGCTHGSARGTEAPTRTGRARSAMTSRSISPVRSWLGRLSRSAGSFSRSGFPADQSVQGYS